MDIEATRKNILESDNFILQEVEKIQYLHALKREIRYGESRQEEISTESVAEHIFGLHILNEYFLPLESEGQSFDTQKIFRMITLHDLDEIVVGDKIGYLKTEEDRVREKEAMKTLIKNLPESIRGSIEEILGEYEERVSIESKFVKALDAIEPLFYLYNQNGKSIMMKNGMTRADSHKIKDHHVVDFPYIKRFNEVVNEQMDQEGFFSPQLPLDSL